MKRILTNGTLETIDGRPALRFERSLAHPVERVWRAVTEPAELGRWFPGAADWTPEAGEVFEAGGQAGEIIELDAPKALAWTFAGDVFRFELNAEGEGSLLVFTHVFEQRHLAAQTAAGWETYLSRLDEHLAGRHLCEERAHEPIGELHERYAERLGLDPAPGRRFIAGLGFRGLTLEGGPSLRLERRYRQSVERVWRALTDPDELRHWFPGDLEVIESEPPHLLAGSWYGDALRIELRPDGEGCVLVFAHTFADREKAARDAAGWDRCFARLDALIAEQPMSEAASLELWPDVHERYAERWQIDPELGRKAYAEHPMT